MTCSCSAYLTAAGGVRYQLDAGCAEHAPSPTLVAHARAEECPCVVVTGGRAYPKRDCVRCRGTGWLSRRAP